MPIHDDDYDEPTVRLSPASSTTLIALAAEAEEEPEAPRDTTEIDLNDHPLFL